MARLLKGEGDLAFSEKEFIAYKQKLSGFFGVCLFALKSFFKRIPGEIVEEIEISGKPKKIMVQAEGEYARVEMRSFKVYKSSKPVVMITRRK